MACESWGGGGGLFVGYWVVKPGLEGAVSKPYVW